MTSPRKKVRSSILIKCLVTAFPHINYVPSQCLASRVKMRSSILMRYRCTNKRILQQAQQACLDLPVKYLEPGFRTVYQKENRNKRSDHLATRETASYILFSAKTQTYKQNTYRKWSLKSLYFNKVYVFLFNAKSRIYI